MADDSIDLRNFLSHAKVQLTVDLTSNKCEQTIRNELKDNPDIRDVTVNLEKQIVVVDTSLATSEVVRLIENTGKKALVTGIGPSGGKISNLGSAVAILHEGNPSSGIRGVTRIVQTSDSTCIFDGTVDGLKPNSQHTLAVHDYGDISQGCDSCGDVMFRALTEGGMSPNNKPYGDLGLIVSNNEGRSDFRLQSRRVKVWDIIGRSMVVSSPIDDNSSPWKKLACGIIARSAGIFENFKKICACDGTTIWEERAAQDTRFPK